MPVRMTTIPEKGTVDDGQEKTDELYYEQRFNAAYRDSIFEI